MTQDNTPRMVATRTITIEFLKRKGEWSQEAYDASKAPGYCVTVGDRYADGLCVEEVIGLIAELIIAPERPHINWLMTREEHETRRKAWSSNQITDNKLEDEHAEQVVKTIDP